MKRSDQLTLFELALGSNTESLLLAVQQGIVCNAGMPSASSCQGGCRLQSPQTVVHYGYLHRNTLDYRPEGNRTLVILIHDQPGHRDCHSATLCASRFQLS